jgi:branched-chain amino acid transport system permease protein
VLRAVREDEDAARALGTNAFSYKLQSLALAATTGALAGFLLALSLNFVVPDEFQPLVTFIGYVILLLGGLANYWGVALGAIVMWSVLEGLRFLELPLSETKIAALRFIILGLVLIGLMAFRPQGFFGKREEMVLGD